MIIRSYRIQGSFIIKKNGKEYEGTIDEIFMAKDNCEAQLYSDEIARVHKEDEMIARTYQIGEYDTKTKVNKFIHEEDLWKWPTQ